MWCGSSRGSGREGSRDSWSPKLRPEPTIYVTTNLAKAALEQKRPSLPPSALTIADTKDAAARRCSLLSSARIFVPAHVIIPMNNNAEQDMNKDHF